MVNILQRCPLRLRMVEVKRETVISSEEERMMMTKLIKKLNP